MKTCQLMLYRELITIHSQNHTEHMNTLCRQREVFSAKTGDAYSDHWALMGQLQGIVFCEIIECGFSKPDVLIFKPKVLLLYGVL